METTEVQAEYKLTPIGNIDKFDYIDQYVRITRLDDVIDFTEAHNWLLDQSFYDTNRPGGWFCYSVRIIPIPDNDSECIGIIHHTQNV